MGKMLKEICIKTNMDPTNISGHSMRKGGAQFAVKAGVPLVSIAKQADWRTLTSLKRYNDNASRQQQVGIFKQYFK